ncbi:MAG: low-specificity L-threonine aldolase [Planctomycetales bacterium]|nr:low-specificity L-threonine aldolase [Planctomycetales bacterium]
MTVEIIDLRSDTVTQPTPAMRQAMAAAAVGDDVLGADPTTAELERLTAKVLGKEAAIFMPSGTMTNQVAVRLHCVPGDEFLCETDCHIYNHEQGAFAQLSGVVARPICGQQGHLTLSQLEDLVRPDNDHMVRTRLVCLENTHNRGGGRVLPYEDVAAISCWARSAGIGIHLDGARLFNAVAATGITAHDWASLFDTVSVCFSKGLGAPVGSALAGPAEWIKRARRHRKLFGGGMRQCGIIAAGALYALQHHVDRLAEDHANAQVLAAAIRRSPGLRLTYEDVETNILFFELTGSGRSAAEFTQALEEQGVLVLVESKHRMRALTHLDVSTEQVERAGRIIGSVAARWADSVPANS